MPMRVVASPPSNEFATSKEAALTLGVEPETLAQWRYLRKFTETLPHYKVGRRVLYRRVDLAAFLETCRVGGTDKGVNNERPA